LSLSLLVPVALRHGARLGRIAQHVIERGLCLAGSDAPAAAMVSRPTRSTDPSGDRVPTSLRPGRCGSPHRILGQEVMRGAA
jgi:hypothetical protein